MVQHDAQELVQVTTGLSFREAATAVRIEILTVDATSAVPTAPWFRSIALAVTAGALTAGAADAIRTGLGGTDFQYTLTSGGSAVRDIRSSPNDPVNITSVERLTCTGLTQTITLNGDGSPLDVGRERPHPRTPTTYAPPTACTHEATPSPNCSEKEPAEGTNKLTNAGLGTGTKTEMGVEAGAGTRTKTAARHEHCSCHADEHHQRLVRERLNPQYVTHLRGLRRAPNRGTPSQLNRDRPCTSGRAGNTRQNPC